MVNDDFAGANGAALNAAKWTDVLSTWNIQSNAAKPVNASTPSVAKWTGHTFTRAQSAQFDTDINNTYPLLCVNLTGSGGTLNGYSAYIGAQTLRKWTNGSQTDIGAFVGGISPSGGSVKTYKFVADGAGGFELFENGVSCGTISDSTFTSAGQVGIEGYDQGAYSVDNFVGTGEIASGGGALPFVTRLDAQRMRQQFARKVRRQGHDIRTFGRAA